MGFSVPLGGRRPGRGSGPNGRLRGRAGRRPMQPASSPARTSGTAASLVDRMAPAYSDRESPPVTRRAFPLRSGGGATRHGYLNLTSTVIQTPCWARTRIVVPVFGTRTLDQPKFPMRRFGGDPIALLSSKTGLAGRPP